MEKYKSPNLGALIFWFTFICSPGFSANSRPEIKILISNASTKTQKPCEDKIQIFISELKTILPGTPISLGLQENPALQENAFFSGEIFSLNCLSEKDAIELSALSKTTSAEQRYLFRWSNPLKNFEPLDWVVFQKHWKEFLENPVPFSLTAPSPEIFKNSDVNPLVNSTKPPSAPLYKKWWFWTAAGVLASAGITLGILETLKNPRTVIIAIQ